MLVGPRSALGRRGPHEADGLDEAPAAKRADTRAVGAAGSGPQAGFLLLLAGRRLSPSVAGADGGAAGCASSSLAAGGQFCAGGGEPSGGASLIGRLGWALTLLLVVASATTGPSIMSAADVAALLADRDGALSLGVTFEAVQQAAGAVGCE